MNIVLILSLLLAGAGGFTMPETIPVAITGHADCRDNLPSTTYPVIEVDFKEYVKGVLPNEWYPTWNPEALKAGAVAVKMFAISMVERRGYVWDCNWSQVYNPAKRMEATDKAVDDTWDYILLKDGEVFTTYYDDYQWTCYIRGAMYNCMGQWETQYDAEEGMNFEEILTKYYIDSLLINTNITTDYTTTNTANLELSLYVRFLKEEHK